MYCTVYKNHNHVIIYDRVVFFYMCLNNRLVRSLSLKTIRQSNDIDILIENYEAKCMAQELRNYLDNHNLEKITKTEYVVNLQCLSIEINHISRIARNEGEDILKGLTITKRQVHCTYK